MTALPGSSINYRVEGRHGAPWLTFSHSLACNLEMWDGQVEALKNLEQPAVFNAAISEFLRGIELRQE